MMKEMDVKGKIYSEDFAAGLIDAYDEAIALLEKMI